MDRNTSSLSGIIVTQPILSRVSQKTQQTEFYVLVKEWYLNKDYKDAYKESRIKIEILGKNSEHVARTFKEGDRVCIEGYLRQQPESVVVRAFTVFLDYSYLLCKKLTATEILESVKNMENTKDIIAHIEKLASETVLKK